MQIDALSQEDIDALFQTRSTQPTPRGAQPIPYDFRRTDRIATEQIRALRAVHDTFARSLASSLSGYLRSVVNVNVISVEQLAYREFLSCLPSPSCLSSVRMSPFETMAVLEVNPQLAFPILELLLGGGKVKPAVVSRQITRIEEKVLDGVLALVLQNLAFSWQSVADVSFTIESHESEPAMLQILAPNDAVVVVASEVQVMESSGMMNIAVPSSIVKLLRQKSGQPWSTRKNAGAEQESTRVLELIAGAEMNLEVVAHGGAISVRDLLELQPGDVLQLDEFQPSPASVMVNGTHKFDGRVVAGPRHRSLCIRNGPFNTQLRHATAG